MEHPGMAEAKKSLREFLEVVESYGTKVPGRHPTAVDVGEALYKLSSPATQDAIEKHINSCPSCKEGAVELVQIMATTLAHYFEAREVLPFRPRLVELYTAGLN